MLGVLVTYVGYVHFFVMNNDTSYKHFLLQPCDLLHKLFILHWCVQNITIVFATIQNLLQIHGKRCSIFKRKSLIINWLLLQQVIFLVRSVRLASLFKPLLFEHDCRHCPPSSPHRPWSTLCAPAGNGRPRWPAPHSMG
jgi:hypothetical protein